VPQPAASKIKPMLPRCLYRLGRLAHGVRNRKRYERTIHLHVPQAHVIATANPRLPGWLAAEHRQCRPDVFPGLDALLPRAHGSAGSASTSEHHAPMGTANLITHVKQYDMGGWHYGRDLSPIRAHSCQSGVRAFVPQCAGTQEVRKSEVSRY
jgi:hypothetical protein